MSHGVIAVLLGALTAACGVFNRETSRQMVPASGELQTEAAVRVLRGENGVHRVTVVARDVVPPEQLAPGATTYVVWLRQIGKPAVNVGVLRVDASGRGFFETTTPHESFAVLVTAEKSPNVSAPLGRAAFTVGAKVE